MSLSKSQNGHETNINSTTPRPPLKINKDSHAIHKSVVEKNKSQNSCAKRQPVIIYTHPPKVIYAKACEFMDIVQKLTGLEKPVDEKTVKSDQPEMKINDVKSNEDSFDVNSNLTDEKFVGDGSSAISPIYIESNPYMGDIPVFSSNSSEFFSSMPMPNYTLQSSSSMANSISPMFMDMMNGFPEN